MPTLRSTAFARIFVTGLSVLPLLLAACAGPESAPAPSATPPLDAYVAQRDPELGVPTVAWLDEQPNPGSSAKDVAWRVLRSLPSAYGMTAAALDTARLRPLHDSGRGPIIAQFEQEVDGIEVFRLGINVAMSRDLRPVGVTGYLAPSLRRINENFTLSADDAVGRAITAMTGAVVQPTPRPADESVAPRYLVHDVSVFTAAGTRYRPASPPRSKRVWFPQKKGLVPAYYVELDLSLNDQPDSTLRSYVISAADGTVLFENDLTANDSYTYRVWADKTSPFTPWDGPHGNGFTPHPTGKRDGTTLTFQASQLVKLESAPFSKNDPWLPAMATEARGNNAVAYADTVAPDGYQMADVMLKPSMPGEFDYALDVSKDDPAKDATTIQAVTTNFFFIVNHLHDSFYDAGWDEASRNPQKDNYGRGGVANDPIKAEAQDNSGRNNANASTPADGSSPRIQMYLFDPAEDAVKVTSPMDLARVYQVGRASFGPKNYDVTADLVVVDDGGGMSKTDGCETPFANAMAVKDKIAVIDRGDCYFEIKAYNAQANGAKGVIIVNNVTDPPGGMAAAPTPPPMPVTIPAMMVSLTDGKAMKDKIAAGTAVTMQLRALLVNNDSSLDGMIVSHEWGHVMSNRLIGNASGLVNNQGRAMGEGWSDFVALLMTTRAEDAMATSNVGWKGAFAAAGYSTGPANNSAYEGIRRYPYSTDFAKNPLMFRHIKNGVALPAMPQPAFGADGISNAQVHNTGEIWGNALWECYVALLSDTARYSFDQAQKAMREYLVAGMKLTPVSPTILEARDAVLMAALAKDQKDFELLAKAFAKRGMGVGAVAPIKSSSDHSGVVESTGFGGNIVIESITLTDAKRSCDRDGILDEGEIGTLTIKLRNNGTLPFSAQAAVNSESGRIWFPAGNKVNFVAAKPYQTTTATMLVMLRSGVPAQVPFDIGLNFNATDLALPGTVTTVRSFVGNYDVVAASSASDTMADASPAWTVAGDAMLDGSVKWGHVREGADGRWSIADNSVTSDQYLVTPALNVSMTGSFGFTLVHRFDFEADSFANYDGGVVEISTDDGKTWTDTAMQLTKGGYNGTLWSLNPPLKSRKAFTSRSTGYPAFTTTEADFGTAYQGKTVKLRFRVGTDSDIGAGGWDLDEIRFTGLTNTPFPSRRAAIACAP